jgi:RNA polymerase sigma-70 factor (ECF subfamily)
MDRNNSWPLSVFYVEREMYHMVIQVAACLQMPSRPDTLRLKTWEGHSGAVYMRAHRRSGGQSELLSELADEELVARCRSHDHEAFAEIVDRYKHKVHWLVRRMVGSPEDEDLTQEVFLRAYEAIPGLRDAGTLRTWLYRIAHNLCLNEIKKRGRRGEHLSLEEEGEEKVHWMLPEARRGLEEDIERLDLSRCVRDLVEQLPLPYRTAVTLFYIQQARYEEISDIMGIPLGTVKTYLHRARLRLRNLVLADPGLADLKGGASGSPDADGGEIA